MLSKNNLLKNTVVILCFLLAQTLPAQHRADNWTLWNTGIHFQNDTVTVFHSLPYLFDSGMGIISDTDGKLLIFTDGKNVFNQDLTIMVGGTDLFGFGYPMPLSLIVPLPNSDSLYYLFFVEPSVPAGENHTGLYYAIVDISLYDGKGAVIYVSDKLLDNVNSRLTAVFHQNYNDIWVITQKKAVNHFYAYLLTENGISGPPVISVGGEAFPYNYSGQLKAAPDGSKIVNSYDAWSSGVPGQGFDTFKFNTQTGELSNPLTFKVPMRGCPAAGFSSDASKLYVFQNGSTGESTLFQYDISEYNYSKIETSRQSLMQPDYNDLPKMQLAPDGKIYMGKGGGQASGTKYLGVINKPNQAGIACDVEELGLYLDGSYTGLNTPNFIQSYFYQTDFQVNSFCFGDTTSFRITNMFRLDSVKWDFGDNQFSTLSNPTHVYAAPGHYTVSLIGYYPEETVTIGKTIEIYTLPVVDLGNDTTVCHGYVLDLSDYPYDFEWSDGSNLSYFMPDTSGTHWVRTQDENNCIYHDSITLVIKPTPYFSLGNDTSVCENSNYYLLPDPVYNNSNYLWNDNTTDTLLYVDESGLYSLAITNSDACVFLDSIFIEMYEVPDVDLGNDTILNRDSASVFVIDAGYFNYGTTYLWDNHSTSRFRNLFPQSMDTGMYQFYVKVTSAEQCSGYDTLNIRISGESLNDKYNIQIYPNPCNDYFIVLYDGNGSKTMKLFNSLGKIVLSEEIKKGRKIVDISGLQSGVYAAGFYENEKIVLCLKIVVQK